MKFHLFCLSKELSTFYTKYKYLIDSKKKIVTYKITTQHILFSFLFSCSLSQHNTLYINHTFWLALCIYIYVCLYYSSHSEGVKSLYLMRVESLSKTSSSKFFASYKHNLLFISIMTSWKDEKAKIWSLIADYDRWFWCLMF